MKISILTLFPEMFSGPFDHSIIKRAKEEGKVAIELVNLRNFGIGRHRIVDDRPYGGGVGMILRVDVIDKALSKLKTQSSKRKKIRTALLDPRGETFNQLKARQFSQLDHLILIAGHYEGVDERVREHLVDESLSIGDYVLTGGEIPAMVVIDAVVRLIPGVLKKTNATFLESFSTFYPPSSNFQLLEHPQYTRPRTYRGWQMPSVLLSGHHREIEIWKRKHSPLRGGH